jgi:pimeloyl-ACP methyl ester carboxylesterase
MSRYTLLVLPLLAQSLVAAEPAQGPDVPAEVRGAIETYLDKRFLPVKEADAETEKLIAQIEAAKVKLKDVEAILRAGRTKYPAAEEKGKLLLRDTLECDHVDYTTAYFLYVPKTYDPAKAAPLLLVGHGGNGAMDRDYAKRASEKGVKPWLEVAEKEGIVVAAPFTERGWGWIGDSILLTLLSRMQREFHIDPDRVYVTGHSMGGHLSWRCGIYMADRWGAICPMSGGYDYVENKLVYNLLNVPGYATYGSSEPYDINKFNNKIKEWMDDHQFDWKLIEKNGGHQIFADDLPKAAQFLLGHPRDLYRPRVYARLGGSLVHDQADKNPAWKKEHTWKGNHPIPRSTIHWLRLYALPKDTAQDKATQTIQADYADNAFTVTSENVRKIRIYLHPKMVDFSKAVIVEVNGKVLAKADVQPSLKTMLELAREFDDPGRIFHAALDVEITTDKEVPEPKALRKGS